MKFFATAIALIASVSALKIETVAPSTTTAGTTSATKADGSAVKCYEMT